MPTVLFDNGLYRMWYVADGYAPYRTWSIGYAVSEDGLNWFHYDKNPVLLPGFTFDNGYTWGGTVLKDGSQYKMYYGAYSSATQKWSVGLAVSTDGRQWTKHLTPVMTAGATGSWDEVGDNAPCVIKEGPGQYVMWFTGSNSSTIVALGYATSPDGITWTKFEGNPILTREPSNPWESYLVTDCRIAKVGTTYHMFYHGAPGSYGYQIGYASSSDGIHWTRYAGNPILRLGSSGSWESFTLSQHWVIWQDSTFKMWCGARGNDQIFQIGYASSPLTPTDVKPARRAPDDFKLSQNYPNPFNPSTTIEYDVPTRSRITLKVYNTLGQEVATLVDEERMPGTYSAVWDAKGVASGTYWSRMTADGKSVVQKMILLK
jgi:predicted GH43/DUF377 family glycosyl hydrolase